MPILNLIRWRNLLILLLTALLIRFTFIPGFGIEPGLNLFHYGLLTLSILSMAAGGNTINNFFDVTTDSINQPQHLLVDKVISRKKTLRIYAFTTSIGMVIIFYLFLRLGFEQIGLVFYIVLCSPLALAAYSIWLKKKAIIGNVVVSGLVGLSLFCLGSALIDLDQHPVIFFTILAYTILVFLLNLARELVKDAEDIRGDNYCQMTTLPILIGKKRTNYIVFGILNLVIFLLLSLMLTYFLSLNLLIFYVFLLIILPLAWISKKILDAKTENDYKRISSQLKLVFLTGLGSMLTFLVL